MDQAIEKDTERKHKVTMTDLLPTHARNRDWNENDMDVLNSLMVRHFFQLQFKIFG